MRFKSVLLGGLAALVIAPASAQEFDMAAVQKWSSARVVRYNIVGVYNALTTIADGNSSGQAEVTDRVTIDLDWDVRQQAMVGQPKVQNSKSTLSNVGNSSPSCAPPTLKGDYEQFEVTEVKSTGEPRVELIGVRSFPEVDVTDCSGMTEHLTIAARQESTQIDLAIPAPMMLVIPPGTAGPVTVTPDKKSFVLTAAGWTWTYTPSIVS